MANTSQELDPMFPETGEGNTPVRCNTIPDMIGISFYLFKSREFSFYLDQELDYNRYRKNYLNLDWYKEFSLFNLLDQKVFCRKYENECLKHVLSSI